MQRASLVNLSFNPIRLRALFRSSSSACAYDLTAKSVTIWSRGAQERNRLARHVDLVDVVDQGLERGKRRPQGLDEFVDLRLLGGDPGELAAREHVDPVGDDVIPEVDVFYGHATARHCGLGHDEFEAHHLVVRP